MRIKAIMNDRMLLSFLNDKRKFNYRVAGVVIRNDHVLVCREDEQDYVFLPGGRVEFGESSDGALQREIKEEMGCRGEALRLVFSVENFFELEGEHFHEIGKYYLLTLPDDFPFQTEEPCLVSHDEGHVLTFYWVAIEENALEKINLLPLWLRSRLASLPLETEHLTIDENPDW